MYLFTTIVDNIIADKVSMCTATSVILRGLASAWIAMFRFQVKEENRL